MVIAPTNLLFIESLDEYFWIPKTLVGYKSFNEYILILEQVFDKYLYKKSIYTEQLIYGLVATKKFINRFAPRKINPNKEKEREQYILALDYFCKIKIPFIDKIEDLKNMNLLKESIYK